MPFLELFAGGECEWSGRRAAESARFTFRTHDLAKVERLFQGMFVELTLRPTLDGGLAFCLDVPDRDLGTWPIKVREGDRIKLVRGKGECEARVVDLEGNGIDLTPFTDGVRHDFSGREAAAFAALARGDAEAAAASLGPLTERSSATPGAHHLYGRCLRALGRIEEAVACYREAVRKSAHDAKLGPWAAGPLSDMGVAYKKLGDAGRAVHCFLHSLHLRPNQPEALLSFFSLMALDDSYALFGAARVLALGGHEDLVDQFLESYAAFAGKEIVALRREAEKLSKKVDLLDWPFRRPGFASLIAFEKGLTTRAAAVASVRSGRWGPGTASA